MKDDRVHLKLMLDTFKKIESFVAGGETSEVQDDIE